MASGGTWKIDGAMGAVSGTPLGECCQPVNKSSWFFFFFEAEVQWVVNFIATYTTVSFLEGFTLIAC